MQNIIKGLNTRFVYWFLLLASICFCIYRGWVWSELSQWREDQSVNLWLSLTLPMKEWVTGLISSKSIPNPNGMYYVGMLLNKFTSIRVVSFTLILSKILLIFLFFSIVLPSQILSIFASLLTLSYLPLKTLSGELWNNIIFVDFNLISFIGIALFIKRKNAYWLILPLFFLLFSPAVYLAGAGTSIGMCVTLMLSLGITPLTQKNYNQLKIVSLFITCLTIFFIVYTWIPYFSQVSLADLKLKQEFTLFKRSLYFAEGFLYFPFALYSYLFTENFGQSPGLVPEFLNENIRVLGIISYYAIRGLILIACVQLTISFYHIISKAKVKEVSIKKLIKNIQNLDSIQKIFIVSMFYMLFIFGLTPLLGGPRLIRANRLDMSLQFFPFIYLFLSYAVLSVKKFNRSQWVKLVAFFFYVFGSIHLCANLFADFELVQNRIDYSGRPLDMDVPATDKERVVDFIAKDWLSKFPKQEKLLVKYDLGNGNMFTWIEEFGKQLNSRLLNPMTIGRIFDYLLLKKYNLSNIEEGVQARIGHPIDATYYYRVSYQYFPAPENVIGYERQDYDFRTLRVSLFRR